MALFDNISKKISDAGQITIQKTKNIAEVAKINSMISDEEKRISSFYEQIGKQYLSRYGENPEEAFKELVEAVKQAESKIKEYQSTLQELKGVSRCPKCGAEVPSDSLFCPTRGTKMQDSEAAAPEEKHCTQCGAVIVPGNKFCTSCGKQVE